MWWANAARCRCLRWKRADGVDPAKSGGKARPGREVRGKRRVGTACGSGTTWRRSRSRGANPGLRDGLGRIPLHVAARAGHRVIVRELLLKGADPDAKTWRLKETPLHAAALRGHALCVSKLLLGGADKDSRNYLGLTPLQLATARNHLSAVEELLAAGTDVNIRSSKGRSAFHLAVRRGHEEVLRALLRHGGDIKASDDRGFTLLHFAAESDNGGIVRALLEAGADIEAESLERRETPLHQAAGSRKASSGTTIHALLEGGADINTSGQDGWTALHVACRDSHVARVELLLRWGADEKKTLEDGATPAGMVGRWELANNAEDNDNSEQRQNDDVRIRHMLVRAPADRSWRRRGWLVLCRSYPTKVQLAMKNGAGRSSAKVAKASSDARRGGDGTDTQTVDVVELVGRVVGLEAEGVSRLVVGFL